MADAYYNDQSGHTINEADSRSRSIMRSPGKRGDPDDSKAIDLGQLRVHMLVLGGEGSIRHQHLS